MDMLSIILIAVSAVIIFISSIIFIKTSTTLNSNWSNFVKKAREKDPEVSEVELIKKVDTRNSCAYIVLIAGLIIFTIGTVLRLL